MASNRSTQSEILSSIVQRLRKRVPELTDATCFVSDQRQPVQWPTGPLCVTVVAGPGSFDESMWAGGGFATLCESLQIQITIWQRCMLDHIPRAEASLQGETGMFSRYKPEILRALILQNNSGVIEHWMPSYEDGTGMLRQPLQPVSCSPPMPEATQTYLGMTLTFNCLFDWML